MTSDKDADPSNPQEERQGEEIPWYKDPILLRWVEQFNADKKKYHELTDAMSKSTMRLIIGSKAVTELRSNVDDFNAGCIDAILHMYKEKSHAQRHVKPSPYDPTGLFQCYPSLKLKKGYCLDSYYMGAKGSGMGSGKGVVFVLPHGRRLPQPEEGKADLALLVYLMTGSVDRGIPVPSWASYDIASFIEGDETPLSYFQASMFARDIQKLGVSWHSLYAGTNRLVTSIDDLTKEDEPRWEVPPPDSWLPVVWKDEDNLWNVSFYTYAPLLTSVEFHNDTYLRGYEFERFDFTIGNVGYLIDF